MYDPSSTTCNICPFNLQPFAASLPRANVLVEMHLMNLVSKMERGSSPGSARRVPKLLVHTCTVVFNDA